MSLGASFCSRVPERRPVGTEGEAGGGGERLRRRCRDVVRVFSSEEVASPGASW